MWVRYWGKTTQPKKLKNGLDLFTELPEMASFVSLDLLVWLFHYFIVSGRIPRHHCWIFQLCLWWSICEYSSDIHIFIRYLLNVNISVLFRYVYLHQIFANCEYFCLHQILLSLSDICQMWIFLSSSDIQISIKVARLLHVWILSMVSIQSILLQTCSNMFRNWE